MRKMMGNLPSVPAGCCASWLSSNEGVMHYVKKHRISAYRDLFARLVNFHRWDTETNTRGLDSVRRRMYSGTGFHHV